jgi:hypothetical protein
MAYKPKDAFLTTHGLEARIRESGHFELFMQLCRKPTATTQAMLPIVEKMIGRRISEDSLLVLRRNLGVPAQLTRKPIECAIRKAKLWKQFVSYLEDDSVPFRELGDWLRKNGVKVSDDWVKSERKRHWASK